jgi:hypothetical protein
MYKHRGGANAFINSILFAASWKLCRLNYERLLTEYFRFAVSGGNAHL